MHPVFGSLLLTGSLSAFLLAFFLSPAVAALARRSGVVDQPIGARKRHGRAVPLLGGLAVFAALGIVIAVLAAQGAFNGSVLNPLIPSRSLIGFLLGGAVLMFGGYLDDRYALRPAQQIAFPIIAALVAVASGIHIPYIRNPFVDGLISFELLRVPLPVGSMLWPADPLTFLWLLAVMYTTKFLDGLDGLVAGLTGIAAMFMFFVALRPEVGQTATGLLALLVAGAFLGFLPWNWSPARIFLGEGGSLFAGFAIGILAVISGSKVATTLLVLGIPLLDVGWVVLQRVVLFKVSPVRGDRSHLHFRLVDAGMPVPAAVLTLCGLALVFGLVGLFAQTGTKAVAFLILVLLMAMAAVFLLRTFRAKR